MKRALAVADRGEKGHFPVGKALIRTRIVSAEKTVKTPGGPLRL